MIRKSTLRQKIFVFGLLFMSTLAAAQTVWTGAINTNWNTPGNWSPAAYPTPTTNIVIPSGLSNYPVVMGFDGIAECADIIVESGATVIVDNNGNGKLRVYGSITNNGVLDITDGNLIMAGTSAQFVPAGAFKDNTIRNFTVFHTGLGGSTTVLGPLDITGILNVESGVLNTGGFITLKSNAQTTAVVDRFDGLMSMINGNVTVERYIPAKRGFRLISPSTTGGTIYSNWMESGSSAPGYGTHITGTGGSANGFDSTTTNNASLFTHNNTNATWLAPANTAGTLTAGTPYRLLVRGDRTVNLSSNTSTPTETTLRTTGTLVTGNVTVSGLSGTAGGFSFVGNPYQAQVDMASVLDASTNINKDFYFVWDPTLNARGGYTTVIIATNSNTVEGSVANRFLQPNQAFFVQTDAAFLPASLTFTEADKFVFSNQSANLYSEENEVAQPQISLAMYAGSEAVGTAIDGFVARFGEAYSNDVDSKDAVKPTNQDENVGLFNSGKVLSVESRALPTVADVLEFSNTTYRGTSYTYKMNVTGLNGMAAYLRDNYTGATTELANDMETLYNFTVEPTVAESTAQNRFSIIFAEALGTGTATNTGFSIYPNPVSGNGFSIRTATEDNNTVTIFNQLGQQVASKTTPNGPNTLYVEAVNQMAAGIYMVQIQNGNKTATQKLIVN